jgi:PAS domain S-box-containing protein
MSEMITIPKDELEHLKERVKKLGMEKSYLELITRMMKNLTTVVGLEDTLENMLKTVVDSVGGMNCAIYYIVDSEVYVADVLGKRGKLDHVEDLLVKRVFATHEHVEYEHDFSATLMRTPEFGKAITCAYPLLVGADHIGVIKMESMVQLWTPELREQMETFFGYAALVLKNEILGYSKLQKAYDQLRDANAELTREVNDRRLAEAALEKSEALLKEVQELARVGGWEYDVGQEKMVWTDETYRIHGIQRDPGIDHIHESTKCYLPQDLPIIDQAFRRCVEEGVPYDLELPFVTFKEEPRWIRTTAKAIDEGGKIVRVIGNIVDITERKKAEKALRKSKKELEIRVLERTQELRNANEQLHLELVERRRAEERVLLLNFALNNVHEAAFLIDENARFHYVNAEACSLLGYTSDELVVLGVPDVDPDFPSDHWPGHWNELKTHHSLIFEGRHKAKDGHIFPVEINANYFEYDGQGYNLALARDITERKRVEEELKQHREHLEDLVRDRTDELEKRTEQLETANMRFREADRLKSVFLASMSHELRTPLNSIIGFTGIMLMGMTGRLNEEQERQLTLVKNSANHLLGLINDVLDIAKIEAGRVTLSLERFEIGEVVDSVIETVSPMASAKGLELVRKVPSGLALTSDKRRVKQILMNIIGNAVKFTEQGNVTISAGVSRDTNLELRFADTGIGIEEDDMKKLFFPFQQIDAALTKAYEGTGLGLYLCKRLVSLLGGDIAASSRYGKGSEFTVVLPLAYGGPHEKDIGG